MSGRVEKVQSFPTEGRSQMRMTSSQMGTTSRAEAVHIQRVPSSRRRGRLRQGTGAGAEVNHEGEALRLQHGGILVVTEVRREVMRDPDFPSMEKITDMAGSILAGGGGDGGDGGDANEDVEVPSLDELPLPDGVAFFAKL